MRLSTGKLFGEITVLMTYCATANMEYLSSTECANRFKNILETIKEYKHIEEELGIDLITLFKVLEKGICVRLLDYTKPTFKKVKIEPYHINAKKKYIDIRRDRLYDGFGNTGGHLYHFKDYGKTWALDKKDLSKECFK